METRTPVPPWLGFSLWWLLVIATALAAISMRWAFAAVAAEVLFYLWPMVQAAWLKNVLRDSITIYWVIAAMTISVVLNHTPFARLALFSNGGAGAVAGYGLFFLQAISAITAICYGVGELRWYVQSTEGSEPTLSYVWAMLFTIFYFQYKLHEIRRDDMSKNGETSASPPRAS